MGLSDGQVTYANMEIMHQTYNNSDKLYKLKVNSMFLVAGLYAGCQVSYAESA